MQDPRESQIPRRDPESFGLEPAHRSARHPPRGSPGEGPQGMPFKIAYLDPEHRFPILQKLAA